MLALCRRRTTGSHTRFSKRRLMRSTGHNIVTVGIEDKCWKYLSDLYTTLIDIKWRWNILIFVSGFVVTWLVFACLYYLLCYLHGDFDEQSSDFVPCILNMKTFTAAYLFSIETMMTIGYGFRVQTESCPGVLLAVMMQSIVGAGLQFMLASIVVSKTRRAKRRSETILFSNQVCIYEQDSMLHLAVRVGDMRKSEIAGAHAQGYLVKKCRSQDGSFVPVRSYHVNFKGESGRDLIFFPWPTQILHLVDEESPLWSLSRDELLKGKFELIVVIDGISGATSRPFQARKSYHTCEMKWGHRFANIELRPGSGGSYLMDLSTFNNTIPTSAPLCSARDITHLREMYKAIYPETPPSAEHPSESSRCTQLQSTSTASDSQVFPDTGSFREGQEDHLSPPTTTARSQRSRSVEERFPPPKTEKQRRCSLGDMIRVAQGDNRVKKNQYVDALNIYRHRRSVTDTYLGEEIAEEVDEVYNSSQAILSVISRRSAEKRAEVRDPLKRRRSSVQLLFGRETGNIGEEEQQYDSTQTVLSVLSQKGNEKAPDVRDVFTRRKGTVVPYLSLESKMITPTVVVEDYDK